MGLPYCSLISGLYFIGHVCNFETTVLVCHSEKAEKNSRLLTSFFSDYFLLREKLVHK